ncbi:MAG: hypothetical protein DMG32_01235 [Acidobacteria bacterium]|nr:MAG: hypothetical protein DMG32_01235 [Acidobacteriota bacterium]
MSARERQRDRQIRRRAFHVTIALILVICAISPFLESAVNWNDTVFATGYDGESTLAVLVLLLELVISLAGVLVCLCRNTRLGERVVLKQSCLTGESGFGITIPELSPPPPLRI